MLPRMNLSSLTAELWCLVEATQDPLDDAMKSLSGLAKFNSGVWKSEKQARFLLNTLRYIKPDAAAKAWLAQSGMKGRVYVQFVKLPYAKNDPTKVRYVGRIAVVDGGGVVYLGTAKVKHLSQDNNTVEIDYSSLKDSFTREVTPTLVIDVDAELAAQAEKNKPDIELIKSIPDWESKDILVSFVQQLSAGKQLSPNQKLVIQKFMPAATMFVGEKDKWAETWEAFKKVAGTYALGFAQAYSNMERAHMAKYLAAKEAGKTWYHAEPSDPDKLEARLKEVAALFKSQGYADSSWAGRQILLDLEQTAKAKLPGEVTAGANSDEELAKYVIKTIKAKKPTKVGLRCIQFITQAVDALGSKSVHDFATILAKRYKYE